MNEPNDERRGSNKDVILVQEIGRCIRWLIVAGTICFGLYWIINGAVTVFTKEKPAWVQAISIIVPAIVGILVGCYPINRMIRRFRVYIKLYSKQKTEADSSVDPNRSSSEINEDGTFDLDS
jgi:hypothetical protein